MSIKEVSRHLAELSAQLNARFDAIDKKSDGIDAKFDGIDKKLDNIDQKFVHIDQKFDGMDKQFKAMDTKFDGLEKKMDDGFNASRMRDEELRGLTRLSLEADEVLRDSMARRFDTSDRKHDEQIGLLRDVIKQNVMKR